MKGAEPCAVRDPAGGAFLLSPWKEGLIVRRGRKTVEEPDEVPLLVEFLRNARGGKGDASREAWFSSIPGWAHGAAVEGREWKALALLVAHPEARELKDGHPFLWASLVARKSRRSPEGWRRLLRRKRRALLAHLSLPSGEADVRASARFRFERIDAQGLADCRELLSRADRRKLLSSFPEITPEAAGVLLRHPRFAGAAFVRDRLLSGDPSVYPLQLEWREALRIAALLGLPDPEETLARIPTLARFRHTTRIWTRGAEMEKAPAWTPPPKRGDLGIPFPEPVLPGGRSVRPIRTPEELHFEGLENDHCAPTWSGRIYRRDCDLYRVTLGRERATLEVRHLPTGPRLGELRGPLNRKVSAALEAAVQAWFESVASAAGSSRTGASATR